MSMCEHVWTLDFGLRCNIRGKGLFRANGSWGRLGVKNSLAWCLSLFSSNSSTFLLFWLHQNKHRGLALHSLVLSDLQNSKARIIIPGPQDANSTLCLIMHSSHCDCHPRVRTLSTCAPCMNNSNQWQVKTDARNRLDWSKAQMCQHVLTTGFHGRFSSRSLTDPQSLCAIYILWMLLDLLVRGNWLPSCSDNRMQIVPVQHPQIVGGLPGIANTYQTHGKAGKKRSVHTFCSP
jgi:hypothetical protein